MSSSNAAAIRRRAGTQQTDTSTKNTPQSSKNTTSSQMTLQQVITTVDKRLNQLEKLGFSLHMFNKVNTKPFKPTKIGNSIFQGLHHLFQLDCVMIKNFQNIASFNKEDLTKLILIMFYSFKSYDFVDYLIRLMDKKFNLNLIEEYRKLHSSFEIVKRY